VSKRIVNHSVRTPSLRQLALFRYQLRRFLRFSERAARACGVTPQQHQLLLGLAGYGQNGSATISEMAEFLQERHNAVVGLVKRAASRGLVRKERSKNDHRVVRVSITSLGMQKLKKLTQLHIQELKQLRARVPNGIGLRPRVLKRSQEA